MRITIVGDLLLDEDVEGNVTRLSPDAPVPVVEVTARRTRPGGAGLVAMMLLREEHDVELVTALSRDEHASTLRGHLAGVRVIDCDSGLPTPVKTRLRTPAQAVCRIDEGCAQVVTPNVTKAMLDAVAAADVIIVTDYGRGLTSNRDLRAALEQRAAEVPLIWDPHPKGADPVPSAWIITPNVNEATAAAGNAPDVGAALGTASRLLERYGCRAVLITLGSKGAHLQARGEAPIEISTEQVLDIDPCGAGDRLAAQLAIELAGGNTLEVAAHAAVKAAGEYLRAGGVKSLGEFEGVFPARAIAVTEDPFDLAARVRTAGGTVVAAGGCFDLLHAGHVRSLEAARAMGDCLIVCMNSDDSVRRLKGPERPLIREQDRAEMLRALSCVDGVLIFSEDGPEAVLDQLRPHYWVKGGDYTPESLPEAPLLETWGGSAVMVPFYLHRSTTKLAASLEKVS